MMIQRNGAKMQSKKIDQSVVAIAYFGDFNTHGCTKKIQQGANKL